MFATIVSVLAEPTTSQDHLEAPESWLRVLVVAFVVWLASAVAGGVGGGLLRRGLVALLPAEAQVLFSEDGFSLCASLFAVPVAIVLLRLEVSRPGSTPREYLGLKWPGLREGLGWGLIILAVNYGYRFLILWLGIPLSKDDRYREIVGIPLVFPLTFVAIAVLAPIFEELLFRGYLLEGLRRSRLGVVGAVLITAAVWAVLHPDLPVRWLGLFLTGILLALARLRTGSTYLAVLLHMIINTVAVLTLANG